MTLPSQRPTVFVAVPGRHGAMRPAAVAVCAALLDRLEADGEIAAPSFVGAIRVYRAPDLAAIDRARYRRCGVLEARPWAA